MQEDDADYKLDELNENEINSLQKGSSKINKLTIILIIIIIVLLSVIIVGILIFALKKDKVKDETDVGGTSGAFIIFPNIPTSENDTMKNTFGIGGSHYIKEIGNINNGKDYEANDRSNFELCIPDYVMEHKTDYVNILFDIHGGAWANNNKNEASKLCKDALYKDFIIANMSHTLLSEEYKIIIFSE